MTGKHELDGFDMPPASLEREWVVTIDTPAGGVEANDFIGLCIQQAFAE